MKTFIDFTIPATKISRKLNVRVDSHGIYVLALANVFGYFDVYYDQEKSWFENIVAGISYQYPMWLAKMLGDKHGSIYVSRNSFAFYVYDAQDELGGQKAGLVDHTI